MPLLGQTRPHAFWGCLMTACRRRRLLLRLWLPSDSAQRLAPGDGALSRLAVRAAASPSPGVFFWLQFSRPWVRGRLGWVCEKLWSSIRTAAVPQVGRAGLRRRAPQLEGRPEKPLGKPS